MRTASVNLWAPIVVGLLGLLHGCSRDDAGRRNEGAAQRPDATAPAELPGGGPTTTDAAPTPAAGNAATTGAASGAPPGDVGAQTFQTYCQTCHGPAGKGDGPAAAGLNPKPASFADGQFKFDPSGNGVKGEVEDIKAVVRDGAAKYGGSPLMAPWPSLSSEQQQGVAEYVKKLAAQ